MLKINKHHYLIHKNKINRTFFLFLFLACKKYKNFNNKYLKINIIFLTIFHLIIVSMIILMMLLIKLDLMVLKENLSLVYNLVILLNHFSKLSRKLLINLKSVYRWIVMRRCLLMKSIPVSKESFSWYISLAWMWWRKYLTSKLLPFISWFTKDDDAH